MEVDLVSARTFLFHPCSFVLFPARSSSPYPARDPVSEQSKPAAGDASASASASAAAPAAAGPAPIKFDLSGLPIRAYLDQTVVPLLLQGMSLLVKEVRPRCAPPPRGEEHSHAPPPSPPPLFSF
jgi:hypothetical protein